MAANATHAFVVPPASLRYYTHVMAARGKRQALRKGWTTGACAAAAARAAYTALVTGEFPDPVAIRLPRGEAPAFPLAIKERNGDGARAGVVKDAGDDPDVTHGALIIADVAWGAPDSGVRFAAGDGVGTVTLPGLPLAVGEPAITDGPRALIRDMIADAAAASDASADVCVTISVPGGAALAERTTNARLGIVGGLSILGTTGIVIPYSCASWIHSINRGVDVARALGHRHIAAATGRTSERAVQRLYRLPDTALIDMGDFAGGVLKYLRRHPVERLTLAGGFAKLAKLAAGHMDLHSDRSTVDLDRLVADLANLGADAPTLAAARQAASAGAILHIAQPAGLPIGSRIAAQARAVAQATLAGKINVDVVVYDRRGALVGRAAGGGLVAGSRDQR